MRRNANDPAARRVTRREVLLTTGAASLVTLMPRELRAGLSEAAKTFVGSFRYAGGNNERELRDRAIDDVVSGMNILVRSIARDRLKSSNVIAAAVRIASDGSELTIALDSRVYTAPLDGRSVKVTGITGDKLDLRYRLSEGKIEQIFSGDDRGRVNTFSFDKDRLRMKVRVYSSQLPKDLTYKLTYQRS